MSSLFTSPWKRLSPTLVVLAVMAAACAPHSPGPRSAHNAAAAARESRPTTNTASSATTIPFDPAVRRGTLDNGLTYFIRANGKPENRAELRLVLNAGSIQESEDQLGLAHFVEHMAFNGTEHFEEQELIDYLEKIGMRFGPDINAYTSFDETVYMLELPTDDEEIVATGFQILEDWAHNVSFDDDEIEKERGVVIEEWRSGRGAAGRIRDQQFPVTFHGSRYAERLPIGKPEILENAAPDTIRRFYRDWYRPDLMALVAVGDFDEDAIEAMIRGRFSGIRNPEEPRERLEYPVPDHEETLFSVVTDPEATSISVRVAFKRPRADVESIEDLRPRLIDGLYDVLFNSRLQELSQKADPPYQYAFAGSGPLGRTKSTYQLIAAVRDGGVERALETLLTEARRVEEHGFGQSELDRARVDVLRSLERRYEERDKQESRTLASQYVGAFLSGEPEPSIEFGHGLMTEMLPGIGLDEINARADQWITDTNRVILVSGPDTEQAAIPDEGALLAAFGRVDALEVTRWVDQVRDEPLVPVEPKGGTVVASSRIEELDITRWELSNGIVVHLKPTDFKNDEVLLRGYSPGGDSLVADDDYLSARMATQIVDDSGLGNFNRIELDKALAGKVASARTYVSELSEGASGNASPKDVETMFRLLYLRFTAPRRDEDAFQSMITKTKGWLENQESSPDYVFRRAFGHRLNMDHPRRKFWTPERLDQVDLERALAVYRERFADASDFQFTLVGNFELDAIRPLVEKWLGGLPGNGRTETWQDIGVRYPDGAVEFEVRRGIEPKSSVRITFHGDAEWSPWNSHVMQSLAEVLRIRLREVLREDLGGVYGVRVYGGISSEPVERASFTVSFGCSPDRVEELRAAVFEEIAALREDGADEEYLQKVREAQIRQRETALERNQFWASQIEYLARKNLDMKRILTYADRVNRLTAEHVHQAAQRYLKPDRYVAGVLYPEKDAQEADASTDDAGD